MDGRVRYVQENAKRYVEWAGRIAASTYTPAQRAEFAIISAHVPMGVAVRGWLEIQGVGDGEVEERLRGCGIGLYVVKTAGVLALRKSGVPDKLSTYRTWREVKAPGMARCKKSFAACLIDPMGSDVLCLDTHMCRLFGYREERVQQSKKLYQKIEGILCKEAKQLHLPPFIVQWASWDWQRGKEENHSFLWGRV